MSTAGASAQSLCLFCSLHLRPSYFRIYRHPLSFAVIVIQVPSLRGHPLPPFHKIYRLLLTCIQHCPVLFILLINCNSNGTFFIYVAYCLSSVLDHKLSEDRTISLLCVLIDPSSLKFSLTRNGTQFITLDPLEGCMVLDGWVTAGDPHAVPSLPPQFSLLPEHSS